MYITCIYVYEYIYIYVYTHIHTYVICIHTRCGFHHGPYFIRDPPVSGNIGE